MDHSDAVVAGAGTVVGALGAKLLGLVFGRSERILREAEAIREEQRIDIQALRTLTETLRGDVAKWQTLYYEARHDLTQRETAMSHMQEQIADLRAEVADLRKRLDGSDE